MLSKNFKFKSFLPPALVTTLNGTFIVPGWYEVPKETTLEEVKKHWEKDEPKVDKPSHTLSEKVEASKPGKFYNVTFDGMYWDCNCVGFGFRKNCRHVEQIKQKHGIK